MWGGGGARGSYLAHGLYLYLYNTILNFQIRTTETISMVPVGNFLKTGISTPIVVHGKIVGLLDPWLGNNK